MLKRRRSRIIAGSALLATLASLASGVVLASPSLADTPTFTLSGTITVDQQTGPAVPVGYGQIWLFSLSANGGAPVPAQWPTDDPEIVQSLQFAPGDNGNFSFSGVSPGRYRIFIRPDGLAPTSWLGSAYKDESTVITVTDSDITGLNDELPAPGSISGTIATTPASWLAVGAPNGLIQAVAYPYDPITGLLDPVNRSLSQNIASDGSYTLDDLMPGDYVVRVSWPNTGGDAPKLTTQYSPESGLIHVSAGSTTTGADVTLPYNGNYWVNRFSGADRFGTAVAVSKVFFPSPQPKANVVFIADGLNYPDALSASAAAARLGGPLLLVSPTGIPATVVAELHRLGAPRIVVVGGVSAVSAAVYAQLTSYVASPDDITRISGADRYATSRAIADFAFQGTNQQTHLDAVFIATGANYPDALVAGGAAGYEQSPVLLVNGSAATLDAPTMDLLTTLNPGDIYVVGGAGAVSAGIQAQLNTLATPEVIRLAGLSRYDTAVAVNTEIFPFADEGVLATASGFADALSISAVSGVSGIPMYLSTKACIPQVSWSAAFSLGVVTYYSVGGPAALSDDVAKGLTTCNNGPAVASFRAAAGPLSAPASPQPAPAPSLVRPQTGH
ncbi:cell wall-binding repeat-containing protein [Diaminobutyricibacter sp. McL0608]|uniref:cell wall-binding repeat-containing protein n=1 Tax=Leifsonia sp. McL0608 TaxID=3143537 RepID=UPI0031F31B88